MIAELHAVMKMQDGYVVRGTVDGHPVSIDLPASYVDKLDRDKGRLYMQRSLIKVFCATNGIEPPENINAG